MYRFKMKMQGWSGLVSDAKFWRSEEERSGGELPVVASSSQLAAGGAAYLYLGP